jgi:hypothetical protein
VTYTPPDQLPAVGPDAVWAANTADDTISRIDLDGSSLPG